MSARVTQLIGQRVSAGYEFADGELLEQASEDGRRMHEIVYDFVSGNPQRDDLSVSEAQRLQEFERWYEGFVAGGRQLVAAEKKLEYAMPYFCGHPDMVFNDAIVDLKRRRAKPRYDALQLAGYSLLAQHNLKVRTKNWHILELIPETPARLVRVYDPHAESLFLALVQMHHRELSLSKALKNYFRK